MMFATIRRSLIIISVFIFSSALTAQEFGGIPSDLKWRQINTSGAKIIFPKGFDSTAMRVAGITDYLGNNTANTIGVGKRKISIVLQTETTISNGYVQLAPWRSEFFMTPLQNSLQLGSVPWTDQLAIHEYRHVQQYMNFRKGLSKFAYYIAGEEGQLLANSAAIPDWFFEGDAVFQETLVTGQGRGRLPSFYNSFRSLWEANRRYSYMKLRNGSFRHLTPNHYPLGYILVSYGREKFGPDIWKKITEDAVAFKPLFYPMQGAIKRHTGLTFKSFVNEAFNYYKNNSAYKETDTRTVITKHSEDFVKNYSFPQSVNDSTIALKSTGRAIPRFVLLNNSREKELAIQDISLDEQFNFKNGKIIYAAYHPDIRWGYRDYSDLRVIDLRTGKRKWLTRHSKYFAPDFSHDGEQVAAVEVKPGGLSSIQLLDAVTGFKLKTLTADHDQFLTNPKFSKDNKFLYVPARRADGKMSILKWDLTSEKADTILPYSYQAIAYPVVHGDTLFFSASHNGQDKLLAWDDSGKKLFEVLNSYTGIQQSAPGDSGTIIYGSPTAWGSMLYSSPAAFDEMNFDDWMKDDGKNLYLSKALGTELSIGMLPYKDYQVKKYSKGHGLFNFHSWRPYYEQPEWSFSIYGNNVLNTFNSTLSYVYNENENSHKVEYTGFYSALFPWIQGGASYTLNRQFKGTQRSIYWNEVNANIGLRLPLNFTGGRLYSNMYLSSLFNVQKVMFNDAKNGGNIENLNLNYLDNTIAYAVQTQKAEQQIFPRFAITGFVNYQGSVSKTEARQLLVNTSVFLPGLLKTHSLVFNGSFQSRDTAQEYLFSNDFPLSRGYPGVNYPRMWKAGVNYYLPLFYPDLGIANIVYFLRVRANLFYDYTNLRSLREGTNTPLRSAGMEIFFDTRWWNQQPISFGIRYSRLLDADFFSGPYNNNLNPNVWEFVLPISLIPR